MDFTNDDFVAITFIFERHTGRKLSDFEIKEIENSRFKDVPVADLKLKILEDLKLDRYTKEDIRVSAYWALGKLFDKNLLSFFQKALLKEYRENHHIAVFQILIGLSNLDGSVLSNDSSVFEEENNMLLAKEYLKRINLLSD